MIDYRMQRRLSYIGGGIQAQMSAWPAGGIDTTGLISWWTLDETSGTRNDSHGTNHLTDVATVLYGTGKQGNAADFERSNFERLSKDDNASLSVQDEDFTIAAWVNFESAAANNNGLVIAGHGEWTTLTGWMLMWHRLDPTVNNLRFAVYGSSSAGEVSDLTPSTGTWYFVVAWHDATAGTVNIQVNNGTPNSTAWAGGVGNTTAAFHLGAFSNTPTTIWGGGWMDGLIDEASFWKRVLTADERTWLWNGGAGRTYSDL